MAAKWQRINLKIPADLKPAQRMALADLVIEHIYDRTIRGVDKDGNRFAGYSKNYIKSLDFKNAGKSKSDVDLKLSGDMLAAMKMLSQKSGSLIIGFENGTPENAKAEGNILGTYGQKSPIRGKARDFLGLQDSKLSQLIAAVKDDSD